MQEVPVAEKRLADYRPLIGEAAHAEILGLASRLRGKRIAHVNATSYGGGVAELLHSIVPLMRDLGLDARWFILSGSNRFFEATKAMHNALQGSERDLTPEMVAAYRAVNETNAAEFPDDFEVIVIHDPQPAPLVALTERKGVWIWRCHIDLTTPNPSAIGLLAPYLPLYDAAIFSAKQYAPQAIPLKRISVSPPAIDPLSPKNREVLPGEREAVLGRLGLDVGRPIVSQVGRFDPWKDPLGVIDVYRSVKRKVRGVQLLLIASMASDDPEGWEWYERTARHAGEDPDIHLLTDLRGVRALEVNVLQRETDVGMLKSIREGFGLTVSESLWKGVPVVGGDVGGIRIQIRDGEDGYLVGSKAQAAARTLELLKHEDLRKRMGRAGRERVRKEFLITRYLRDYLRLFAETSRNGGAR